MSYSYLFGLLVNLELSVLQWIFFLTLIILLLPALIYSLHFAGRRFSIVVHTVPFVLALFATGIAGLVGFSILYLIFYALFADFRTDYD